MKKIIFILLGLLIYMAPLIAQNYCNLIQNPKITGCNCSSSDPFAVGNVPDWEVVVGTPSISTDAQSSPTSGAVWSNRNGSNLSGEAFGQPIGPLVSGKTYIFSCWVKQDFSNPANTGSGDIYASLTHDSLIPAGGWASSGNLSNLASLNQFVIGSTTLNGTAGPWKQISLCFTPTQNWNYIMLWGEAYDSVTIWTLFDDVELFEVKAYAGNDSFICDSPTTVMLGKPLCSDTSRLPITVTQSFKWTIAGSSSVLDTSSQFLVTASGRTIYVLEHTLSTDSASCTAYDTVVVCQSLQPEFDLGPDDTLCAGTCTELSMPFDSSYTYSWNTGETTQTINACSTGTYIGTVTTECNCIYSDSIHITVLPEITLDIPDQTVCTSSFPISVSAPAGFSRYQWSTGDSAHTAQIDSGGTYYVTVTDINGCHKTDTFIINEIPDVSAGIEIISDTSGLCNNFSIELKAVNLNSVSTSGYSYYWYPGGQTTSTINVTANGTYWVKIYAPDSSCFDSAAIEIEVPECCNLLPDITNLTITSNTVWQDTLITIDGLITVTNNSQLTIRRSELNMLPCAQIVVDRGSELVIEDSEIGLCDSGWKGIEIWGHIDACPEDLTMQGRLIAYNSSIKYADIAVFAGRRGMKDYAGGILIIEHCLFEDNFVDIMFDEWNYAGVCGGSGCNPPTGGWQSHVWHNDFLPMRDYEACDNHASNVLATYGFGTPANHCHIIDLSWNPNVYTIPSFPPHLRCNRDPANPNDFTNTAAGASNYGFPVPAGDVFNNNTYASPCSNPSYK